MRTICRVALVSIRSNVLYALEQLPSQVTFSTQSYVEFLLMCFT